MPSNQQIRILVALSGVETVLEGSNLIHSVQIRQNTGFITTTLIEDVDSNTFFVFIGQQSGPAARDIKLNTKWITDNGLKITSLGGTVVVDIHFREL